MQNNSLTLFSSYAKDRFIRTDGSFIKEEFAGPAYYISRILNAENIKFINNTTDNSEVEICITKEGEFGKISIPPNAQTVNFDEISRQVILISGILNEFDISNISHYTNPVYIDIQGYVRDGHDFGKKKTWNPPQHWWKSFSCLKGTEKEMTYIPKLLFENQKQRMLIITKNNRGATAYIQGKKYTIRQQQIVKTRDTVGAGDTFFAAFICAYLKTKNAPASMQYASQQTTNFLKTKRTFKTEDKSGQANRI